MSIRALVVDDNVLFRKVVSDALSGVPDLEIVGTANNGKVALARILELKPDLVTLDIEMPELNGIQVLEALRERKIAVDVIVLSALTERGGQLTVRALELGAFDFLTKPASGDPGQNRKALQSALQSMIDIIAQRREIRSIVRGEAAPTLRKRTTPAQHLKAPEVSRSMERLLAHDKPELVVIGVSTGGPNALAEVIPRIPADINVPILIVQHMPPLFTQSLAQSLGSKSVVRVHEAQDGEVISPNTVYIAPGGKQMKVASNRMSDHLLRITDDPPENNCKPSVDYLFRSVSQILPGKATAVIMTGMGGDGTLGLRLIKRHGGTVIAQDEETSIVFGMPREAILAGVVDVICPLQDIALEICKAVRGY